MKLNNPLLPYQKQAVNKLIKLKVGALFFEQGTGKTITTLEIARIRYESNKIDSVIWLCPCSAKGNIKREIIKQCPKELLGIFTICGIETLSQSIRANEYLLSLTKNKKCFLVIDESLLIKNPRAYRTNNIDRISKNCTYKIILNGTPISRNEADLYAQFRVLDWRILGYKSYWSFAANHLEYDEYGKVRRVLNLDYLTSKFIPYTVQVLKKDCIQLPSKKYHIKYFYLTDLQEDIYGYAANILMDQLDDYRPDTIYRLFSGLQAIISGKNLIFKNRGRQFKSIELFKNPMDNPRIRALLDILTDDKTIIFCRYESEISQICQILKKSAVRFDGSVSLKDRDIALGQFRQEKKYLVANKNCAGFSLNLQFCHNIIYFSNDWELGKRLQSEDRVHRIGQKNAVHITDICAAETIDESVLECLYKKEDLLFKLKNVISNTADLKSSLKKYIYGSRFRHDIFNPYELEDTYVENIQRH